MPISTIGSSWCGHLGADNDILLLRWMPLTRASLTIEVAQECSRIRSTLALLIIFLLADYLSHQAGWRTFVLVLPLLLSSS